MALSARTRWAVASGLGALALYAVQVPTVSGDKDGSEFTLALSALGVPHPTGYPLYVVFGHVFGRVLTALGLGWPSAANAWSAVGGAVAVGFAVALVQRLVHEEARAPALLLVAVLFGLNPLWTYEAVLAEVYSWHVAWALGAALVFVVLVERLARPAGLTLRWAAAWGLVCGLGAAHHATSVLVAVPLSVGLAAAARKAKALRPREVAVVVGVALGTMLVADAFVAWRAFHPGTWQWPTLEPSWTSVVAHLRGSAYGSYLGRFRPSAEQQDLMRRWLWPSLVPSTLGLGVAAWRAREALVPWTLLAVSLSGLGFALSYGVPDPSSYFLVPLALGWVGTAVALGSLRASRRVSKGLGLGAFVVVLAVPGAWWVDTGLERRAVFQRFDEDLHSMWASVPFDEALVVMPSDLMSRLVEYQQLRGEKPHIDVVNPLQLADPLVRARFEAKHGFDPLAGLVQPAADGLPTQAQVDDWTMQVCRRLNQQSRLPVVLFVPETGSVRLMRK